MDYNDAQEMMPGGFDGQNAMQRRHSSRAGSATRRSTSQYADGLARHGSVFHSNRERETQASVSLRGPMANEGEELQQQGYGDMAKRSGIGAFDGMKSVKSYRGEIQDGDDVGLPRRVTTRRNVGAATTGYAGIAFRRAAAMRNGMPWAGSTRREQVITQPQMQYEEDQVMAYPALDEVPQEPQVYLQEDKRTYSNMSDMYA